MPEMKFRAGVFESGKIRRITLVKQRNPSRYSNHVGGFSLPARNSHARRSCVVWSAARLCVATLPQRWFSSFTLPEPMAEESFDANIYVEMLENLTLL